MASSTRMLVIFSTCVMLASVAAALLPTPLPVVAVEYKFVFYQQIFDSNQILVFPPYYGSPPQGAVKGQGYVFNDPCTATASPGSAEVALFSGFYVYSSDDTEHELSSIEFKNFNYLNGNFVDATLGVTGQFFSTNGVDNVYQELSVTSGTKALAGAEGTLKYTKVASSNGLETYKVEGVITVPLTL